MDGTTGGGGHSLRIAQQLGPAGRLICIDRDEEALAAASRRQLEAYRDRVTFVKKQFCSDRPGDRRPGIGRRGRHFLFDLGVSSYQLDNGDRGFSYMHDAPLDMRMDRSQPFFRLGCREHIHLGAAAPDPVGIRRRAVQRPPVAAAIVQQREESPIETTAGAGPGDPGRPCRRRPAEKQHPAKRSFQAIRIEVNGELQSSGTSHGGQCGQAAAWRTAGGHYLSLAGRPHREKSHFAQQAKGCTPPAGVPGVRMRQKAQAEN